MNQINSLFFLVAICLWSSFSLSNDTVLWNPSSDNSLLSDAIQFLDGENKPAESVEVLLDINIDILPAKVIKRVKRLFYLYDDSSVETYSTLNLSFNEKTDVITLNKVTAVNNTKKVSSLDPSTIQIVDSDTYNTFTDGKVAVLLVPGVEPDSILILDYELESSRTLSEVPWAEIFYVQNLYPRFNYEINITWPNTESISWASTGANVQCTEQNESITCKGNNISAVKNDESVSWYDQLDQIQVSELNSWDEVIDLSQIAFSKAKLDLTALSETANSLVTASDNLEEKIAKIYAFVTRNIRYASVSELGHQITPHTIGSILENRFGDCKDKTALLLAMLSTIGVDAYPVLVATDRFDVQKLKAPTTYFFDHVVACFKLNNTEYCLDATDTNTSWKYVSAWIQGKASLPLTNGALPSKIPQERFRWKLKINTEITFDQSGGQVEHQSRSFEGAYAGTMRSGLRGSTEKDIDDWAINNYQEVVSNKATPTFSFSNIDSFSERLGIESKVNYQPFLDTEDTLNYFEYDNWLVNEINSLIINNEYYPYEWPGLHIESTFTFNINNIWKLIHSGAHLNIENEYGSLKRHTTRSGNESILFRSTLEIPARVVNVTEFEEFSKFLQILKRESSMSIYGVNP